MLLSVIVPVYNAGEHLAPCLRSLIAVPVEKEIIVVDDGSSDGAIERLPKDIGQEIQLIRQANRGVSAARNAGLERAQGEWLWFADADDEVECNEAISLLANGISADAQLLTLPFIWEEDGQCRAFTASDGEVPYNLWRCWFRRESVMRHGLHFTVGRRYGEDQEFILSYLLATGTTARALATPTYHYTMRTSGVMRRPGTRCRQRHDVTAVLFGFMANATARGKIAQKWVLHEVKRLIKNIINI
ncbi:MAG: glycosyltransferase family 2 protein [Bacteroidales bacterium]|nr:glycosyltransferase family 2 protein [Bacteroidales bacterium]